MRGFLIFSGLIAVLIGFVLQRPAAITDNLPYDQPPPWFIFIGGTALAKFFRSLADSFEPPAIKAINFGFMVNKAVTAYACTKTGIVDSLPRDGQTKTVLEIAASIKGDTLMTRRFVRACASIGVISDVTLKSEEDPEDIHELKRKYQLNPVGDALRSDHPFTSKHILQHLIEDMATPLTEVINTLKDPKMSPFAKGHNMKDTGPHAVWDYFQQFPEQQTQFNKAMTGLDGLGVGAIMQDYNWADNCDVIIDVGGGVGSLLFHLLKTAPNARGILFDIESAIKQAKAATSYLPSLPKERVTFHSGSFFEPATLPKTKSNERACYVSKVVLHDWSDSDVSVIVGNLAKSMKKGDKYILLESIQDTPELSPKAMMDIHMMSIVGRERTVREFEHLFAPTGLKLLGKHLTRSLFTAVEFQKN